MNATFCLVLVRFGLILFDITEICLVHALEYTLSFLCWSKLQHI